MYMMMAAMPAVTQKETTVTPIILPAFFMESMLAIAEAMEQKTMGTTTQNIRLINTVPKGSSTVAPGFTTTSPSLTMGNKAPTIQPAMTPASIMMMKL